jgi:hypothetical protein
MRKSFPIPKVVRLPGWPIKVRLVEQAELDSFAGGDCDAWFDYNDDGAEILILKTLPITQQRACLAHEIQHAVVDYLDVLVRSGAANVSPQKKGG